MNACGDVVTKDDVANIVYDFKPTPPSDTDIFERERIHEEHLKTTTEKYGSWGPLAPLFPPVKVPEGQDPVQWKRQRVIEVAKRYIGLPYQHQHVPGFVSEKLGQGLDCSNYTAWVYNFALGVQLTSHCQRQAESELSKGRKLGPEEKLELGDLLFILKGDKSYISHVVIFVGDGKIIDSRGSGGVQIRNYAGWYKTHHTFTRRVIEKDLVVETTMMNACGDVVTKDDVANIVFDFKPTSPSDDDIFERERIHEEHLKTTTEKYGSWGPSAPQFPPVTVPEGQDPVQWKRQRVIEVAKRYIGLPYQHQHVPGFASEKFGQGLDCSNYTSWVYNFALGIHFTSHCQRQAESELSKGRKLGPEEKLEPGDLLFILKGDKSYISHVVIFVGDGKIIDSRGTGGVQIRNYAGWYKTHHIFTRRLIEEEQLQFLAK